MESPIITLSFLFPDQLCSNHNTTATAYPVYSHATKSLEDPELPHHCMLSTCTVHCVSDILADTAEWNILCKLEGADPQHDTESEKMVEQQPVHAQQNAKAIQS